MPHDHHRCECEHAKVKFCAKCKVVHCLDCKQEWTCEPCTRPHYGYPWTIYNGGATSTNIQLDQTPQITWSNPPITVCDAH